MSDSININVEHLENHELLLNHLSMIKALDEVVKDLGVDFILENYAVATNFIKSEFRINLEFNEYLDKVSTVKSEFEILKSMKLNEENLERTNHER